MARTVTPRPKEKTIELRVRFWTGGMAGEGQIKQKHAWGSGSVHTVVNPSHGIESHRVFFHSLAELPLAVEKLLIKAEVSIHASPRMATI